MKTDPDRKEKLADARARTKELQTEFAERGDALGWFDVLYRESQNNNELIPWADLEPNRYMRMWAETRGLRGNGQTALVVGCGLGDDARYLHDLGFKVTGFDISPTAIEWARRLHADTDIQFYVADLFDPPSEWLYSADSGGADRKGFDLVLEVYTIQPLPIEMRPRVIDAIAGFASETGHLLVVTRGREDDERPDEVPWPVSRRDLSRFEENGLRQADFIVMQADEEDEPDRFVVEYLRGP